MALNREQVREAVGKALVPYIDPTIYSPAHGRAVTDLTDAIMDLDEAPTVTWELEAERDKYREACVWALDALLGMPESAREGEGDAVIKQLRNAIQITVDTHRPPTKYIREIRPTVSRDDIWAHITKGFQSRNKATDNVCRYLTAAGVNVEDE
jgi:hypothetical protein